MVYVLLKPGLENFEHDFTSMWDECNCAVVWAFFGIAFLWDWNENWPFPVLWPLLSFPVCWHIECSTLTASSFRIWNSFTGIPSPPLALLIVMLPKTHLTSHSRMSGSRWVITSLWLSGSWRSFLDSSSVYSCHFFLISSTYVKFIPFLSFIEPIFAWNVPLVSLIFLKRSLVFPICSFPLFICIDHWRRIFYLLLLSGTLHSSSLVTMISKCYKHFPPICFFSLTIHAENQPQKYMTLISPFLFLWLHSILLYGFTLGYLINPLEFFFFSGN